MFSSVEIKSAKGRDSCEGKSAVEESVYENAVKETVCGGKLQAIKRGEE